MRTTSAVTHARRPQSGLASGDFYALSDFGYGEARRVQSATETETYAETSAAPITTAAVQARHAERAEAQAAGYNGRRAEEEVAVAAKKKAAKKKAPAKHKAAAKKAPAKKKAAKRKATAKKPGTTGGGPRARKRAATKKR